MMMDIVERLESGHTFGNTTWPELCHEAAAEIERLRAELEARDGFVMVPVEPSEAMVKAMCAAIEDADMIFIPEDEGPPYRAAHWQNEAHDAYRAMIAARPQVKP